MKILVCISNVPDTTTKISFNNGKELNTAGVQFIINPYDEIALTRALEIKEALGKGSVTVIHVGPPSAEPNIRKALAIGADDAIRVNAEPRDASFVAEQIAGAAKKNQYDIIFTGRESIDYNGAQVGGMVAALLDLPYISVAAKLDINGNEALLEREIDGGKEVIAAAIPFVVSAQKGMAEPRIPNMRGIMTARTKPLQVLEPAAADTLTASVAFELPPPKSACKILPAGQVEELVNLLHTEAKVI